MGVPPYALYTESTRVLKRSFSRLTKNDVIVILAK